MTLLLAYMPKQKVSERRWVVKDPVPQEILNQFPEVPALAVTLAHHRGIATEEEIEAFLNPEYRIHQHDPYLFVDMRKAVDRIVRAISNNERIVIHGDYDADGVCGSAVLYTTLRALKANVEVYLPHRDTEGYGLNMNTVQTLQDTGTRLIITVDCGISNVAEVEKAVELGMDVIVTDHHSEPPSLPKGALAILNPKVSTETYPFKFLAGVGVAFKLSQALITHFDLGEAFEKWLLDLVAISTVTDFVSLTGENRVFEKYGLVVLRKNKRLGLQKWFEVTSIDPSTADTGTIGFKLGPHINAAGRVKHANMAFELLVEEDPVRATELAEELKKTNASRQRISDSMGKEAIVQAEQQKEEFAIVAIGPEWPVGLVGLVAGRISSEYMRPSFVISKSNGTIMGSGRSVEQFNLVEALQSMPELFVKYGGHPQACGFTIKDEASLEQFILRMRERARTQLQGADMRKTVRVESVLRLSDIDWKLFDLLLQCAPYGEGNPEPIFVSEKVMIEELAAIGKTAGHLRLTVSQGASPRRKCIAFGYGELAETLRIGQEIDIAYTVTVNEWNGNRELQLAIKDIHV